MTLSPEQRVSREQGEGASLRDRAGQASPGAAKASPPSGDHPSRDDFDYDENDCANCGGEGFTYGCSWDWQCDTYHEGEGTCLCTRRCEWCAPRQPDSVTRQLLAHLLKGDRNDD